MEIKNGTKVWLKHVKGAPAMIVKFERPGSKNEWVCNWFVNEEIREHAFTAEELTDEEPPKYGVR